MASSALTAGSLLATLSSESVIMTTHAYSTDAYASTGISSSFFMHDAMPGVPHPVSPTTSTVTPHLTSKHQSSTWTTSTPTGQVEQPPQADLRRRDPDNSESLNTSDKRNDTNILDPQRKNWGGWGGNGWQGNPNEPQSSNGDEGSQGEQGNGGSVVYFWHGDAQSHRLSRGFCLRGGVLFALLVFWQLH